MAYPIFFGKLSAASGFRVLSDLFDLLFSELSETVLFSACLVSSSFCFTILYVI